MLSGKRILVAGGGGSIGSELVRQLAPHNKIFILDIDETSAFDLAEELQLAGHWVYARIGDICDVETVEDLFSDFRPEIVINAAARKHVKPMEETPMEAVNVNILGNHNLVAAAKRWKSKKFVFISTDKAVSSNSIMGATKRCGEIITRNQGKGFIVVRFGNVMGSRGSVIPFWQNQVSRGESITVTDQRMERYMMTIEQACSLVIEAASAGQGGEIFILDMGEKINILGLAKKIIQESGKDVPIKMIGTRPGETFTEELMTLEEKGRAKKRGKFWIVL